MRPRAFLLPICVLSVALVALAARRPTQAALSQNLPDPATFELTTTRLVPGLQRPVAIANAGDGSGRLFVIEKEVGRVRVIENGQLLPRAFLDIRDKVDANGNEKGLLGIVFHPRYRENGFFYVNYTAPDQPDRQQIDCITRVERYKVSANPNIADESSAKLIISYDQPFQNHNGGHLAFGPDGNLYIGTGDGGAGGDPGNRAQNRRELLGKMLRIDVDGGDPYRVPPTNPFVGDSDARPEIWAYGLRNPWRYAFDGATGDLYIADVGQNAFEEIDFQPASSEGGENYGWRVMEGESCFNPRTNCDRTGLTLPIFAYGRSDGASVTGGEVYRGEAYPSFAGTYVFADYVSGNVWASNRDGGGRWRTAKVGAFPRNSVSSFGLDENGELLVAFDGRGEIHRVVARDTGGPSPTPTPRPSETATAPPSDTPRPTTPAPPTTPPPPMTPPSVTPNPSPTFPSAGLVKPGAALVELPGTFTFTEGPAADRQGNIYFSDVQQSRIHKWTWSEGNIALHRENTGRSNGLYFDSQGRLVACESGNQRITRDDLRGGVAVLTDKYNDKSYNAPNDLWVDARDGVYFSDPAYGLQPGTLPQDGEHVYYIPPDGGAVRRVTTDLGRPNGIIGTRDGRTLYVANPGANQILRYAVQPDASLADKTVFVPNRGADGMTMDERGNVYLANQGIWIYDPAGTLIERIAVPEAPTNLTFGGQSFATLFITARTSVFTVEMTVRGAHAPGGPVPPARWWVRLPLLLRDFERP